MRQSALIWLLISYLLKVNTLCAQPVLYAPAIGSGTNLRYEVIGKAGNFYWVHKANKYSSRDKSRKERHAGSAFELYDARLNLVKEIPYQVSDSITKEYLVAGSQYFDQVLLQNTPNRVIVLLNRFTQDGSLVAGNVRLRDLPGKMKHDDFLLIRSQDRTKVLLLGFEPVEDAPPYVHAMLFDNDWNLLYATVFKEGKLAQPFLQLDQTSYPLEDYDNSPVKVANNGDWLMVAPSRRKDNYLLCHFRKNDSTFIQSEIKQSQGSAVQYSSLSLDNEAGDAIAGMLVSVSLSSIKKVRLAHYVLPIGRMVFDTTFQFKTPNAVSSKEMHVYEQDFIPIPGKGFMYLKEYGRTFSPPSSGVDTDALVREVWQDSAGVKQVPAIINRKGYTRFGSLAVAKRVFERGDLYVNYFPVHRNDSCWTGLVNIAQTGELNSSFLSYACMTVKDKIMFLYNSSSFGFDRLSSTTILDSRGYLLDEGLVFWKGNNIMNFQQCRQIGPGELAVFYERNRLRGFAIIRL